MEIINAGWIDGYFYRKHLGMTLTVNRNKSVAEIQEEFNRYFPYLRLEFFLPGRKITGDEKARGNGDPGSVKPVGSRLEGALEVADTMTISQFEESFLETFGLRVQVLRRSGSVWLQTSLTSGWSLKRQNEQGREISMVSIKKAMRYRPGNG